MGDSYRDAIRKQGKKAQNTGLPRTPERAKAIRWAAVRKEYARIARKRGYSLAASQATLRLWEVEDAETN